MSPLLRFVPISGLVIILSLPAPMASAQDVAPQAPSRTPNEGRVNSSPESRWDNPSTYQSYPQYKRSKGAWERSGRSNLSQHGRRAMRYGVEAERNGDKEKACEYYSTAQRAFSSARNSKGMEESEINISRTCQA